MRSTRLKLRTLTTSTARATNTSPTTNTTPDQRKQAQRPPIPAKAAKDAGGGAAADGAEGVVKMKTVRQRTKHSRMHRRSKSLTLKGLVMRPPS
jgi:hypothetical protein